MATRKTEIKKSTDENELLLEILARLKDLEYMLVKQNYGPEQQERVMETLGIKEGDVPHLKK